MEASSHETRAAVCALEAVNLSGQASLSAGEPQTGTATTAVMVAYAPEPDEAGTEKQKESALPLRERESAAKLEDVREQGIVELDPNTDAVVQAGKTLLA